jgi:hypothetical protein
MPTGLGKFANINKLSFSVGQYEYPILVVVAACRAAFIYDHLPCGQFARRFDAGDLRRAEP